MCVSAAEIYEMVRPWEDNTSPFSYSVNIMGQPVVYCNDSYCDLFLRDQGELDEFNSKRLYSPFLWGRAICPDDHPAFFAAVVQASCGVGSQSADISLVIKCLTKRGEEFLGLARLRSFYSNIGLSHAFSIVTIPPSCYTGTTAAATTAAPSGLPSSSLAHDNNPNNNRSVATTTALSLHESGGNTGSHNGVDDGGTSSLMETGDIPWEQRVGTMTQEDDDDDKDEDGEEDDSGDDGMGEWPSHPSGGGSGGVVSVDATPFPHRDVEFSVVPFSTSLPFNPPTHNDPSYHHYGQHATTTRHKEDDDDDDDDEASSSSFQHHHPPGSHY